MNSPLEKLTLNISKVTWIMSLVFIGLLGLHLFQLYDLNTTGMHHKLLDFNKEHNLPTLFATLNLLFSGYLIFNIFKLKAKAEMKLLWLILSLIFVFLAMDEFFMFHDGLSKIIRPAVADIDFLHFAWVIPYAVLLLFFAMSYFKFFFSLPNKFKWLFGLSGFIFVLGAVGFEMIGAPRTKEFGRMDLYYSLFTTIEESLEFIGIIVFNYSLLTYLKETGLLKKNHR